MRAQMFINKQYEDIDLLSNKKKTENQKLQTDPCKESNKVQQNSFNLCSFFYFFLCSIETNPLKLFTFKLKFSSLAHSLNPKQFPLSQSLFVLANNCPLRFQFPYFSYFFLFKLNFTLIVVAKVFTWSNKNMLTVFNWQL